MSYILSCKVRQWSTRFPIISEKECNSFLVKNSHCLFAIYTKKCVCMDVTVCERNRQTDREMEIETKWVFSLKVFSFSSWQRCSGQRDSQRSFPSLSLDTSFIICKPITQKERATRPPGQNSTVVRSAFLPWQFTSSLWASGFSGKHLDSWDSTQLSDWREGFRSMVSSALTTSPRRWANQSGHGAWRKVAWLNGSSWTRATDFQGQFQHGWTPPSGFQGCRVWAGTMHVYPLKTESINTLKPLCGGPWPPQWIHVWGHFLLSFPLSLPPSPSSLLLSFLSSLCREKRTVRRSRTCWSKGAALENLRSLPDITEINPKPKQHTYTSMIICVCVCVWNTKAYWI